LYYFTQQISKVTPLFYIEKSMNRYDIGDLEHAHFSLNILHNIKLGHGFQHLQGDVKVRVRRYEYMHTNSSSKALWDMGKSERF
jgi:hypothetical protein